MVFFVFFFFFFYIARRLYAKTFCALSTKERKVPFLNETLTLSTPLETKRRKEIKMFWKGRSLLLLLLKKSTSFERLFDFNTTQVTFFLPHFYHHQRRHKQPLPLNTSYSLIYIYIYIRPGLVRVSRVKRLVKTKKKKKEKRKRNRRTSERVARRRRRAKSESEERSVGASWILDRFSPLYLLLHLGSFWTTQGLGF